MKKGDEIMTKAKKKRGKKEDDNRVLDWKLKPTKRKNAALPKQKKGDEEAKQSIYIYICLPGIYTQQAALLQSRPHTNTTKQNTKQLNILSLPPALNHNQKT